MGSYLVDRLKRYGGGNDSRRSLERREFKTHQPSTQKEAMKPSLDIEQEDLG